MVLNTLIATSADLAGDRAVIARAEAIRPDVAAASDDIEDSAPAAAGAARQAARRAVVPPVAAALDQRDRNRSHHLLPRHRNHRQGRCLDRLVPQPGRRLRDVGGLSRPAGGAGDLRRSARGAGLGARPQGPRGRMRGRLQGDRRVVLCLRRPACDLARRALPDLRGRRLAQIRRQRRAARAHHAGALRGRRVDRHLEHRRPARHRQRPVRAQRFLRARRPFDHPRIRPGMPRDAARSTA